MMRTGERHQGFTVLILCGERLLDVPSEPFGRGGRRKSVHYVPECAEKRLSESVARHVTADGALTRGAEG